MSMIPSNFKKQSGAALIISLVLLIVRFVLLVGLLIWVALDVSQKKHAIIHNFPIIGHFRYWLEMIGPELGDQVIHVPGLTHVGAAAIGRSATA